MNAEPVGCKECNKPIEGNFCMTCGRSANLPRIDYKYLLDEIGSVLSLKKGILYSIRELTLRPGSSIRAFIRHDRKRLVKPVIFVIFCSFLYTMLQQTLGFDDGYVNYDTDEIDSSSLLIFGWVQENYGYANILMSAFIAVWIKVLFRKYNYNFFEIWTLLFFVFGIGMLLYAVFGVFETIFGRKLFYYGGMLGIIYSTWAIAQFFDGRKVLNYIKALLSYFLGLITFTFAALGAGALIDSVF